MEVGLTSPNNAQLVAYGTVQNVDANSKCLDGKPLSDFVEVLVNIVLRESTLLPRAQGRITKLGNVAAQCIPWPRQNVSLDIYMYLIFICKHYNSCYAYFSAQLLDYNFDSTVRLHLDILLSYHPDIGGGA
jgi:hypothetical protein